MIAGIYKITNKINNKSYIGISNDILNRWKHHISKCDSKLHEAINKYGLENFTFEIIDTFDENKDLNHSESWYIRTFDSIKHGYNTRKGTMFTSYKLLLNSLL